MPLNFLPDMVLPVTAKQADALMNDVQQFNMIDGCLTEPQQRALGIHFHIFDLFLKSKGKFDYRGRDGHERLKQDAMAFCGPGNHVAHRHGDLSAAHLSIDYHDTSMRLKEASMPPLPVTTSQLLDGCIDLCGVSIQDERRIGLILDYLGKRALI